MLEVLKRKMGFQGLLGDSEWLLLGFFFWWSAHRREEGLWMCSGGVLLCSTNPLVFLVGFALECKGRNGRSSAGARPLEEAHAGPAEDRERADV